MNAFWKRRSPFWRIAFLLLLSLLFSAGIQQFPRSSQLELVAQQWVNDCLGYGRGRATLLSADQPLKMVVTLDCNEREAETVARGLHTLLSTDPRLGDRLLVVRGPAPLAWQTASPWLLWLASGVLLWRGYRRLKHHSEFRLRGSGLARVFSLGCGWAFLGLAWESSAHRLSFLCCSLLCFCWNRVQRRQGRRHLLPTGLELRQEAAVLLMSLPPEVSAGVFKELGPEEVCAITLEVSKLPPITPEVRRRVLERFRVLSSLDLRKSAMGRFYLGKSPLPPTSRERWLEAPIRWTTLALHLLGALSLASWVYGSRLLLPMQRPALQAELSRYLGTSLKVVQCQRGPGALGVVVSLPQAQDGEAQTTLPLIQDRLKAMDLAPERTLVVATQPRASMWLSVAGGSGLLILAMGWLALARMLLKAGRRAVDSPPRLETGIRRRRPIFACPTCEEVFVEQADLQRHQATHHPPKAEPPQVKPEGQEANEGSLVKIYPLMEIDPVSLEMGTSLLPLVDQGRGARLLERVTTVRRHIALSLGLVLPGVRFRDNLQLKPEQYVLKVREIEVASGVVWVNHFLAVGPEEKLAKLRGERVQEPIYGMPASWIPPENRGDAERLGCMIFDPVSVVATHLTEVVRQHSSELFTFEACQALLDSRSSLLPIRRALAQQEIGDAVVWKALLGLVRERVCIRDLETILQSFLDGPADSPGLLTELARTALGQWISKEWANDEGVIQVLTLEPAIEVDIEQAVLPEGWLSMAPDKGQEVLQAMVEPIRLLQDRGLAPVILTSPKVRPALRLLSERSFPKLTVLSWNEVAPGYEVNSVGMITL